MDFSDFHLTKPERKLIICKITRVLCRKICIWIFCLHVFTQDMELVVVKHLISCCVEPDQIMTVFEPDIELKVINPLLC